MCTRGNWSTSLSFGLQLMYEMGMVDSDDLFLKPEPRAPSHVVTGVCVSVLFAYPLSL